jgi:hypothetical protein
MRGLSGFVLLAGIGVGLFVYLPAPVDRSTTLEQATRAAASQKVNHAPAGARSAPGTAASAPGYAASTSSRLASFAPGVPLKAAPGKARIAAAAAVAPAAKVEPLANWQTNVTPVAGVAGPAGSLEPTDPDTRYKLVVDIQQQLKRVGCYWGRVNGAWNANTREAMRDFTTRSNAALPVDKPDYMLLTMLKSHPGRSCGAPETTTVTAQPGANGRQAAAPEVLPWKAANAAQPSTRLYTPIPTSIVSSDPLPGRMAIGGPTGLAPATQPPLIPGSSTPGQQGTVAALEPGAAPATGFSAPGAAPKPRQAKKASSRRVTPGTPRYNLMLSLGGVY